MGTTQQFFVNISNETQLNRILSIFSENQVSFMCHMKKGGLEYREEEVYEAVQFIGYFSMLTYNIFELFELRLSVNQDTNMSIIIFCF